LATVLLVDDDTNILGVTTIILEYCGYTVRSKANGREALDYLESLERGDLPDLILSDTMMPAMDGRELRRRLQANPSLSSIPFVLMSAALRAPAQEGLHYSAFLAKPFMAQELLSTLEKVLGEEQTMRSTEGES
jgi:two-component system, chemotaxis family, chemotaxis protein CheY